MTRKESNIYVAGLLACCALVTSNAEITGSGLRNADCHGQINLNLWIDHNENGVRDAGEAGLPMVTMLLSNVEYPELGVEIFNSDNSGLLSIGSLCEGVYALEVDASTISPGTTINSVYESGVSSDVSNNELSMMIPLVDGIDSMSPGQRELDVSFNAFTCDIEAVASCGLATVAVGDGEHYECDKPVSELSVVWNGDDPVRVVAHAGKLDDPVIADFNHVAKGQVVTVAGLEDSGNDIIWEIYVAGTDIKIGESSFHLSCSDHAMDGPEDCGVAAGDGKNNDDCTDDSCLNDWLFAGLIDKHNEIQCLTSTSMMADTNCVLYRDEPYSVRYRVMNNATLTLALDNVVEALAAPDGVSVPQFASGQSVEFAYFDSAINDLVRTYSAKSGIPGLDCEIESSAAITVLEPPPACDAVSLELKDISHDKFKIRFTNTGDQELSLTRYQLTWPQEHEQLVEVKWDGDRLYELETEWQPLTIQGIEGFLLEASRRMIPADGDAEIEFKFAEHVHNSPQLYDLEFGFDTDCSLLYTVAP